MGKGVHIGNVINMDEMPEKSKRNETYQQTKRKDTRISCPGNCQNEDLQLGY